MICKELNIGKCGEYVENVSIKLAALARVVDLRDLW